MAPTEQRLERDGNPRGWGGRGPGPPGGEAPELLLEATEGHSPVSVLEKKRWERKEEKSRGGRRKGEQEEGQRPQQLRGQAGHSDSVSKGLLQGGSCGIVCLTICLAGYQALADLGHHAEFLHERLGNHRAPGVLGLDPPRQRSRQ